MKFKPGDMLPTTMLEAVTGEAISLPDAKRLVHPQFRRFVDCPNCNKAPMSSHKKWEITPC